MLDIDAPEEEPVNYLTLYCVATYQPGCTPRERRFRSPSEAKKCLDVQEALGHRCYPFTRLVPVSAKEEAN